MGDKQTFLGESGAELAKRLVTPNCVKADGTRRPGVDPHRGRRRRLQRRRRGLLARVQADHRHSHRRRVVFARQLRQRGLERGLYRRRDPQIERQRPARQPHEPVGPERERQLPRVVSGRQKERRQRRAGRSLQGSRAAQHRVRLSRWSRRSGSAAAVSKPSSRACIQFLIAPQPWDQHHRRRHGHFAVHGHQHDGTQAAPRLPQARLARRRDHAHRRGRLLGRPAERRRHRSFLHVLQLPRRHPTVATAPPRREGHRPLAPTTLAERC